MSYHHLTLSERKFIALLLSNGASIRSIANSLHRSPSTISREIKRNRISPFDQHKLAHYRRYRFRIAHKKYLARIRRKHKGKYDDRALVSYVQKKLLSAWSPEQVAGRLPLDFPQDPRMRLSHSTIYRWLHKDLISQAAALRLQLRHYGHEHGEKRGKFSGIREIKSRSKLALRRKRLGDWEVDTIVSSSRDGHPQCLLSLCDRKSRYCGLVLLKRRTAPEVMRGFRFLFGEASLPLETMTADRGKEFACFNDVEEEFGIPFYFARPSSPWQKPSVENLNGLVRQFFPRGVSFHEISQEDVSLVMNLLNNRPRKSLGFKTPAEVLHLY